MGRLRGAWRGALLAAAAVAACGTGVLQPQREALDAARSRWTAADLASYTFVVQRLCFCIDEYVRPMRIEVVDGTVVSAVYVDDGSVVPEEIEAPTVAGLFEEIEGAIEQEAHSIEATYHAELGYPLDVSIDFIEHAVDEELGFRIHTFDADPGAPAG